MDSSIILGLLCLLFAYTLFYAWNNDFGMFLFIFLIVMIIYYIWVLIEERINAFTHKVDVIRDEFTNKISDVKSNLSNLSEMLRR